MRLVRALITKNTYPTQSALKITFAYNQLIGIIGRYNYFVIRKTGIDKAANKLSGAMRDEQVIGVIADG
jgi:hypothetical protein